MASVEIVLLHKHIDLCRFVIFQWFFSIIYILVTISIFTVNRGLTYDEEWSPDTTKGDGAYEKNLCRVK